MNIDEIIAAPGWHVRELAAKNMGVIVECLTADYVKDGVSEIKRIVPDYEHKCVTVSFVTDYLSGVPKTSPSYFADLMRIADAVGIRPIGNGRVLINFTSVVWD